MKTVSIFLAATMLSGCAALQFPEVGLEPVVQRDGASARIAAGFITISNRSLTCGGAYGVESDASVTTPVECIDGRKGTARLTRSATGQDGSGRLTLNDGLEADFSFSIPVAVAARPEDGRGGSGSPVKRTGPR